MEIEIWSDIMCPFCYIGKRKLEQSIKEIGLENLKIIWRSYQLNPYLETDPNINMVSYLSQQKGISIEQAQEMNNHVSIMAKQEGLTFNLNNTVVANSFRAHELVHYAARFNKQSDAKELLFKSYLTDGKNIDDTNVLIDILTQLRLEKEDFERVKATGELGDEVKRDMLEAQQLRITGVPFFVYNRKYGISGAQPQDLFNKTLFEAYEDWVKDQPSPSLNLRGGDAPSCGPDGCN